MSLLCPLSCIVAAALVALGGIFLNYKYPKYDWTQETQVVKRSAPVSILALGAMVPGLAVTALTVFFGWIPLLALAAVYAALAACLLVWLKRAKLFV